MLGVHYTYWRRAAGFFFVWIITLGVNCFRAQSESTEGLRFPIPLQTVLCQCYQNKWAYFIFLWIDSESFLFSWAGSWNICLSCTKKKLQVLMQHYITASCETIKWYSCESHTSDHISHPFNKKDGNMLKCRKW